ncbi:MAG: NAD(P)H-dependent oxidoreductase [Acidobacteriota bacterium]
MKTLIIFSHPSPKSFNAAILDVVKEQLAKKNAEIRVKDLYAMNFDPVLSATDLEQLFSGKTPEEIAKEQADVAWAEQIIFISPIWWASVTSMMRGYIDRVFQNGFAFRYTATGIEGLLKNKRALAITTSGAAKEYGGPLVELVKAQLIGGYCSTCGISDAKYMNLYNVPRSSDDERKQMLADVAKFVEENA